MKSKLRAVSICLIFGAAITSTNLAADSLIVPPVTVNSPGQIISGQFSSSSVDYAILSNSVFATATQGYGAYTDLVGPTFTVVQPRSTLDNFQLGSYTFVPGTPRLTAVIGTLSLFYTLYSVDPNSSSFDPIADYVSNDVVSQSNERIFDQQANSGPPLQAAAPEPGSWALAAAGMLLVSFSMLRKRA